MSRDGATPFALLEKISNARDLVRVLQTLPENIRHGIALECSDKINKASELVSLLNTLPKASSRLDLAQLCADKITNAEELIEVLNSLLETHRLAFATIFSAEIKSARELAMIFNYFDPGPAQIFFATSCLAKIENASKLIEILRYVEPKFRRTFAISCLTKIKSADELVLVLEAIVAGSDLNLTREEKISLVEKCSPALQTEYFRLEERLRADAHDAPGSEDAPSASLRPR